MLNIATFSEYSDYLTKEDRLSASSAYREVLPDCTFSRDDFECCLTEEQEWGRFLINLENLQSGWTTLEEVAYRWAIPVVMVKYYYQFDW